MKVVIGHKNLNLEELFQVSYHSGIAEVVIDSVTNVEFAASVPGGAPKDAQFPPEVPAQLASLLKPEHVRAIILVKLLQIVKMKKSATRTTVDFLVNVLNSNEPLNVRNNAWLTLCLQSQDGNFFKALFELAKSKSILFSEKELFILGNQVHSYNAIFAIELYKLSQQLRVFDTTLAFTLETLNVHTDFLTDYALTLGKSTQGVTNFKNNMQALTDKSKLLNSAGAPNKAVQESLQLSRVYQLQSGLHERLLQLCQMVANEMNTDYGSLFSEKKYKELLNFAKEQQSEQLQVFALQLQQLTYITSELTNLSVKRTNLLVGTPATDSLLQEESKSSDINETFENLSSSALHQAYLVELFTSFQKNRAAENELKAKAASAEEGAASKKKKQAPTTLQFGLGTRKLFDYLI